MIFCTLLFVKTCQKISLYQSIFIGYLQEGNEGNQRYVPCFVFLLRGEVKRIPIYISQAFESGFTLVSSSDVKESNAQLEKLINCCTNAVLVSLKRMKRTGIEGESQNLNAAKKNYQQFYTVKQAQLCSPCRWLLVLCASI